jgi:hypothetical protein
MIFFVIVTLTSLLLAAIMSVFAWRLSGDERRRSDARVAALAEDIQRAGDARVTPRWDDELPATASDLPPSRVRRDVAGPDLFVPSPPSRLRLAGLPAGAALLVAAAAAVAILAGGQLRRAPRVADPIARSPISPSPVAPPPLELVALGQERVGDQLTVRGTVRNPSATEMDRLTAVVLLLTPEGDPLTSGRAAIDAPALEPGAQSTFVVTLPGAGDVGRYRVSFRAGDRVVSHVDRRHEG